MRRLIALVVAVLAFVPSATGATPSVTVSATPTDGAAPLAVSFTATGDAVSYHWDFGDGASADGASVEHTYAAGRWTATLTARSASGEALTTAVAVTARGVTLTGPASARYGRRATFRGAVVPAEGNVPVTVTAVPGPSTQTRTHPDGTFAVSFRLSRPAALSAKTSVVASAPESVTLVPQLRTRLVGGGTRDTRFVFVASVRPKDAGRLDVTVTRGSDTIVDGTFQPPFQLRLDTRRLTTYRIRVGVEPATGFTAIARLVRAAVVLPRLALGSRSAEVAQLGARLRELHYAAPETAVFDSEMLDAVYAFQKVQGLPRTGVADAAFWHALSTPRVPSPRYDRPGDHIEIDKPHQVLYVVRGGRIALIVPVSTAGLPGRYTPVGRFAIYRKVAGFDPSPLGTLYDPMYFTGGYAIHGNPSVPPYPASHGCVRVPMWLAPRLFATNPYGETVDVY
jgi:L,D-transpeptidase-like protein/PKD domain-containing protein/putative peptidoglycan binding protein